jgi:hypothetical protein
MTAGVSAHDWLPGPLTGQMPLSIDELQQLYASNLVLTEEDISELSQVLPYLGDVLSPEQFRAFVLKRWTVIKGDLGSQFTPEENVAATSERTLAAVADLCGSSSAKVVVNLRKAVYELSSVDYQAAYERLADLSRKRDAYRKRTALIGKLAQAAPNWAAAITARKGAHAGGNIPGDAVAAWNWQQARESQRE